MQTHPTCREGRKRPASCCSAPPPPNNKSCKICCAPVQAGNGAAPAGDPGSHNCFFVRSTEEYVDRAASYFLRGLELREKVKGFLPQHRAQPVLERMRERMGGHLDTALARGQLGFADPLDGYLEPADEEGRRSFSGEAMMSRLKDAVESSLADGYTGLRVAGDMGWIAHATTTYSEVREYEATVTAWMENAARKTYTAMCIFDTTAHPATDLLDILFVHPTIWCRGSDGSEYDHRNLYFLQPMQAEDNCPTKLDLFLANIERWERAQQELVDSYSRVEAANRSLAATVERLTKEVAERKAVEASLEASRRQLAEAKAVAEAASQCKSDFLCTMSHELRTPLSSMIMCAEELKSSCTPDQQREVSTILTCGSHLLTLISDILDLNKVEQGKLELERRSFSLRAVVADATRLVACRAAEARTALLPEVEASAPEEMVGDEVRLRQILVNLLSNAVKFTRGGRVWLRVSAEGPFVRFEVQDEGIGIAKDRLERIFDRFSQADASTTRKFGGTGLGLPIVRHLARLWGGSITVASEPGVGSTFSVLLPRSLPLLSVDAPSPPTCTELVPPSPFACTTPIASPACCSTPLPAASTPAPLPRVRSPDGRPLRVLLCDDNVVNQALQRRILERLGYAVEVASNGVEAVAKCRAARFDVCLMDLQMPVLDGIGATTQIIEESRRPGGIPAPVFIALTAAAIQETREACTRAGMSGFLSKPVTSEKLRETLRSLEAGPSSAPDTQAA